MLFDLEQFEQHFDEKHLQKGLRIFERSGVELLEKHGYSELRFMAGRSELLLRKKGKKLLGYECACGKKKYCEHLAAALFYLQQETLGLNAKKTRSRNKSTGKGQRLTAQDVRFFLEPGSESGKLQNNVYQQLHHTEEENSFGLQLSVHTALLQSFLKQEVLTQVQIDEAAALLSAFQEKARLLRLPYQPEFYAQLALLCLLQALLQLRFSGHEEALLQLEEGCYRFLEDAFSKGLSAAQKAAWQQALHYCLRNNAMIRGKAYSFLLPRLLSWLRSKPALESIKQVLGRRKYKVPYHSRFNRPLIALLQVQLREASVFKTPVPANESRRLPDELLAEAELNFCAGKSKKAFALLEANYGELARSYRAYAAEISAYTLAMAKKYRNADIELRFLEERIVNGLYLQPGDLERFIELLPGKEKDGKIGGLIAALRAQTIFYSFDKLSLILLRLNRTEELIREIKKQDNAYRLLHQLALQKLPHFTNDLLLLYARQFNSALGALRLYNKQQELFENARGYIDQLPDEARSMVLDKIITHSGSESQISKYIRETYRV